MTMKRSFLMKITRVLLLVSLTAQYTIANSLVNCNEYQRSLQLDDSLRMDYVVYENENDNNELYMKVQLVLEEDAASNSWIGFGIHEPGTLTMVPGEAIIGIPSATTAAASTAQRNNNLNTHDVFKYSLGGYAQQMIQKFPTLQQTLEETEIISDNTTMTVLRFTKKLNEGNNELRIFSMKDDVADQINNFMWAYGFGTALGYHRNRGSFAVQAFSICDPNSTVTEGDDEGSDGFIELDVGQSYPELFALHGLLATIAWGVLSPLAIGSAMLRKYLKCLNGALWFKCHYYFNLLTFIFTLVSFGIAVVAHQKSTPEGQNPKHFVAFAHATVGLIIMIFLLIQVFNGWFRPHPVSSSNHDHTDNTTADEEGDDFNEKKEQEQQLLKRKKQRRSLWEYCHRIIGAALIGICWYQIHDGMTIYIERYNGNDYRTIFWSITGSLCGFISLSYMCSSKPRVIVKDEDEDTNDDHYYRNHPTNNIDNNDDEGNNTTTNNKYTAGGTTNVELYDDDNNGIETRRMKSYNRADSFKSC